MGKVVEDQGEVTEDGEVHEETVAETTHLCEEALKNSEETLENNEEAEVTVSSVKNKSFSSVKKQIQISVKKLISKRKKPKKDSIMLVNSIIDDIIREVEGEEEEVEEEIEVKEEIESKHEDETKAVDEEKKEDPAPTEDDIDVKENTDTPEESESEKTGVLDKSKD